ncbi:serine/threonine protein kinase [Streptomyces sp. WZ.A104]|uniref:protein kinase domain-containing protein n=1 Tax=Streptomyces sp. WZ.A104 TaxID=2023771 RepID=UPI000BBC11D8|nr:protein kinase [Streptomyces sp. WZ.A104]PCG81386.1 serine/threonine protein kinase [Streptomyces sp. WZ.A104]
MATTTGGLRVGPDSAPDRYRLRRSIGRGGEAVLYLADLELSGEAEPVVVKVLDTRSTMTAEGFARISAAWSDQAELLRFVHRVGVIGVREHFEGPPPHPPGRAAESTGRCLYLVMNHVEGLDLRDWRAERTLETPDERREAVRCLEQLAEVLDRLHSGSATPSGRVVVHGDLSPGNVMVDSDGQATLVDFGLSKLAPEHRTAEVWFTPGFAAPEVHEGVRSPAADRYAFGALAYFLLSGETPPATPEQLRERFTALPEVTGLPPEQRTALLALYEADPGRRPESLTGWVRQLRPAVVATTSRARTVTAPPPPTSPPPGGALPGAASPGSASSARPHYVAPQTPPAPAAPPGSPTQPPTAVAAPAPGRPRRKYLLPLGAAAAVTLLVVGAVLGSRLASGDDDGGTASGKGPEVTRTATESPAAEPSTEPGTPSESPGTPTADPSGTPDASPSSDSSEPTAGEPRSLTALTPVDGSSWDTEPSVLNTREFETAMTTRLPCHGIKVTEYNLERAWSSLRFIGGITDDSPQSEGKVTFLGDGKILESGALSLGKERAFDVPVDGVLRLRVTLDTASGDCKGIAALADPVLEP